MTFPKAFLKIDDSFIAVDLEELGVGVGSASDPDSGYATEYIIKKINHYLKDHHPEALYPPPIIVLMGPNKPNKETMLKFLDQGMFFCIKDKEYDTLTSNNEKSEFLKKRYFTTFTEVKPPSFHETVSAPKTGSSSKSGGLDDEEYKKFLDYVNS